METWQLIRELGSFGLIAAFVFFVIVKLFPLIRNDYLKRIEELSTQNKEDRASFLRSLGEMRAAHEQETGKMTAALDRNTAATNELARDLKALAESIHGGSRDSRD